MADAKKQKDDADAWTASGSAPGGSGAGSTHSMWCHIEGMFLDSMALYSKRRYINQARVPDRKLHVSTRGVVILSVAQNKAVEEQ